MNSPFTLKEFFCPLLFHCTPTIFRFINRGLASNDSVGTNGASEIRNKMESIFAAARVCRRPRRPHPDVGEEEQGEEEEEEEEDPDDDDGLRKRDAVEQNDPEEIHRMKRGDEEGGDGEMNSEEEEEEEKQEKGEQKEKMEEEEGEECLRMDPDIDSIMATSRDPRVGDRD